MGKTVSCFITTSNYIMCLYSGMAFQIFISVFDTNLNNIIKENTGYLLSYVISDPSDPMSFDFPDFTKCIHLIGETGVFIFFRGILDSSGLPNMIQYPLILFKTFNSTSSTLNNYLTFSSIELNYKTFNSSALLNDIIRIADNKLCFISTSDSKEELYIVFLNIVETSRIIERYYIIPIFNNYNFKFLGDMRIHLYNNYVAFAFSFCRQSICENKNDENYAGFMIFSYPNGTDYSFNLTDYLLISSNKIDNIIIDLKENFRIDNNIFGMVYSGIKIKEIKNCDGISFLSNKDENRYIADNSILAKDEKIKL